MTQYNSETERQYLDQLLNETEAADFLCYSVRALQNWRVRGGGPMFVKVSEKLILFAKHTNVKVTTMCSSKFLL